jgi:hypothetical protein
MVPLRLSRSLIWKRPSTRRSKQCFRETEGSVTATTLVGSRPTVASPSGSGMVESFEGPAITSSLGRNQVSHSVAELDITARTELHSPLSGFPISERLASLSIQIANRALRIVLAACAKISQQL